MRDEPMPLPLPNRTGLTVGPVLGMGGYPGQVQQQQMGGPPGVGSGGTAEGGRDD